MNGNRLMEAYIETLQARSETPRLLLHACCAPCSSGCLDRVTPYFDVTVFYYNPNITEEAEYRLRAEELKRLLSDMPEAAGVKYAEGPYDPQAWLAAVAGLENEPEGGKRCAVCFRMRLREACRYAAEHGFTHVTTTLTLSPLKNAELLNAIGGEEASAAGVVWLPSDFKKKDGYKRSLERSKAYGLYRQDYCGCAFSKRDAARRRAADGGEA